MAIRQALFWGLLGVCAAGGSSVVEVADSGYKAFTESTKRVVVLLYAGSIDAHEPVVELLDHLSSHFSQKEEAGKDVVWGRLDVDQNPLTPTELGLRGTPQMLVYEEGQWVAYPEEFFEETMQKFLNRLYGDEFEPGVLSTAEQLAQAEAEHDVALFYGVSALHDVGWATPLVRLLAKKHRLAAFVTYGDANPDHRFSLRLKRDFNEGDLFYGGDRPFLPGFVRHLADNNAQRRCPKFNVDSYKEVFGRRQPMLLLFDVAVNTTFIIEAESTLRRADIKLACRVLPTESEYWRTFAQLFAVSRYALPFIGIVTYDDDKMTKYAVMKPSVEDAERFYYDYIMGTLQPFYKSESVPTWQDPQVTKVVRENFAEVVIESDQDVFLCAYTRFCRDCDLMLQKMKDLATVMSEKHPNVQFAMIDIQFNDIENVGVPDPPSFFLYKVGEKESPIAYEKPFTIERVDEFLDANLPAMSTENDKPAAMSTENDEPAAMSTENDEPAATSTESDEPAATSEL